MPYYNYPFGNIPINQDLVESLIQSNTTCEYNELAYAQEHSIEVQLPFIETFLPTTPITPIITGQCDIESLQELAQSITLHCSREETLIIVSTDFSHFYTADVAEKMDRRAIELCHQQDISTFITEHNQQRIQLCGFSAMLIALYIMKEWPRPSSKTLSYKHSGMVSGDYSSVVGYASLCYS